MLRCAVEIRPERLRAVEVDMVYGGLCDVDVDEHHDAHALLEPAWYRHLVAAQERHLLPTELSGGGGRELGRQVGRRREKDRADILDANAVSRDDLAQKPGRRSDDRRGFVLGRRYGAAYASYRHGVERFILWAERPPFFEASGSFQVRR